MKCKKCKGQEFKEFEKQMEGVRLITQGETPKVYIPNEPNYRIMYWKEANGSSLDFSEGWFYIHDKDSGEPIECTTLEEVQAEMVEQINKGHKPMNLKIVREYPFKVKLELRQEVIEYHEG